ncbi:MAG: hypothetical protein ACXW05_16385 [Gemmatirosa sp.]
MRGISAFARATLLLAPIVLGAQEPRVRLGTAITPDTVTVGDPFVVIVRIQAPPGAQVTFPTAPDSGAAVELLDPRRDRGAADSGDVTATYRMAAWDVGTLPLRLGDVVVRVDGVERRVPLTTLGVHVRSVLPADSALRVPKPAREPIADPGLWWLRWLLLALALLALLALLLWLARRWWRGRRPAAKPDAAYATALAAFDRLDKLDLVASGEPGRHVALAEEIMREYLAARLPEATPSRTSSELRAALATRDEVPHARLAGLLETSDLVKFAAWPIGSAPAADAAREARRVVDDVERAIREREAREREEAESRARAEREARRRYEEEQRRRSARGDGSKDRAA